MGALHLKTKKQITPDNQTAVSGKSPEKRQPERDWPSLLAIVGLALAFRLIYFWQLTSSPVYQYRIHDSAVFHELAHSILKNGIILAQPFYLAPLYTYFLAAIYFLFGDALNIVRVIQFTLGVGTAWLVFRIARHFFDRQTGLVAGLLAAVYAPFLFFEGNLLGTAVETFLLTASVGCLIETQKERRAPGMAFLSGLALALAATGRPNLLLLAPLPLVFFLIDQKQSRKKWTHSLLAITGLALPLLLTGIHNYLAGGQFTLLTSHGGINFYIGNHAQATGVWMAPDGIDADVSAINLEQSRVVAEKITGKNLTASEVSWFWMHRAVTFIGRHPLKWAGLMLKKVYYFWLAWEAPLNYNYYFHQQYSMILRAPVFNLLFYLPLALCGMIFFASTWKKQWFLYAIILLICLSVILFFVADRYRISALPFLIVFAAAAVIQFYRRFREKHPARWFGIAGLILIFGVQFSLVRAKISKDNFANDYYNLALAHLIGNDPHGAITWGQRAATVNPAELKIHYNLGLAWMKLGEDAPALQAFQKVLEIDPTDAGAWRNQGALLLKQRKDAAAVHALQQALKWEPRNVTSLMNLGLAFYYRADLTAAIAAWSEVLKIEPANAQAQKNIYVAEQEQQALQNNPSH